VSHGEVQSVDLGAQPAGIRTQAANLLVEHFDDHPRGWPDIESATAEVADVDLYGDVPRHIADLQDLGTGHPFLFYRRLGYVVTGLMPDANGRGKPDIYMSKPVRPEQSR